MCSDMLWIILIDNNEITVVDRLTLLIFTLKINN